MGLPLSTLMPQEDAEFWADALAQRRELYPVLNVAGVHVVANAAPVADWDAGRAWYFPSMRCRRWSARESGLCGSATCFSPIWPTAGLKT